MKFLRAFGGRHPKCGAILYVSSIQYFTIQLLVSLGWSPPYSWKRNTISDLGNTMCERFNGRHVCSPLHLLMNLSFILLGLAIVGGSILIYATVARTRPSVTGFSLMGVGGVGVMIVGVFPENSFPALHGIGATLPFLFGNVGVVLLGLSLPFPVSLRAGSVSAGVVALVALAFYISSHDIGLGEGGLERVVAYPQTLWMIVLGGYILLRRRVPVRRFFHLPAADAHSRHSGRN